MTVLGRLLDDRHIPDAAHCHVEGPGNGGRREVEHIHGVEHLLEPLLVRHTEPLFLVDDGKAQILELHVLLDHPMGAR